MPQSPPQVDQYTARVRSLAERMMSASKASDPTEQLQAACLVVAGLGVPLGFPDAVLQQLLASAIDGARKFAATRPRVSL